MSEFELDDLESAGSDEDSDEAELSFGDNGMPGNYVFCVGEDPDLGFMVCVIPKEYWEAEEAQADWPLKLEVGGFTQEMDGAYTYDSVDRIDKNVLLEMLHKKFEKRGCTYSAKLAAHLVELGNTVYRPE